MNEPATEYDAILLVSFGGPEGRDDVMPFLENVLRGRDVPRERMLEVAEHYYQFDGVSPINEQCRALIAALRTELDDHDIRLPIYWGNRNWHPMLAETMANMKRDGIRRALAFVTAAYSSYSGCRQYREDIIAARAAVGTDAPDVDKIRVFYNHPEFIRASVECVEEALNRFSPAQRASAHLAFTAHSIPNSMAAGCDYVTQLTETCRLTAEAVDVPPDRWRLVYQSRSGPPQVPWLEPDICDHLQTLRDDGVEHAVVMPVGFLSDHMEVLFDLDHEAQDVCHRIGLNMVRAATVGTHSKFVSMIRSLITERLSGDTRECVGQFGPNPDVCPQDCCPAPARRGGSRPATSM